MITMDRTGFLLGVMLLLTATGITAQSRVYRWVDANGVVHFSDDPPPESANVAADTLIIPSSPPPAEPDPLVATRPDAASRLIDGTTPGAPSAATEPSVAQAPDCSSPSPIRSSGQDLYEVGDELSEPLTVYEIESFATVIEAMRGRWTGTDVGFSCEGGVTTEKNRKVVAEGEITEALNFVLHSNVSSGGSSRNERLRVEISDRRQVWVNNGGATLFAASDRGLEFGYRILDGGAKELYWRIDVNGKRDVQIRQRTYANGTLIETSNWDLKKPF
jgi:hypothetical protein